MDALPGAQDAVHKAFAKRCRPHPGQVLRYALGGSPLWFCAEGRWGSDVPACACGAPRVFEFQVMPQLISLLETDRLDFGIVAVYTCSEHCPLATGGYAEEAVCLQAEPESWTGSRRGDFEEIHGDASNVEVEELDD